MLGPGRELGARTTVKSRAWAPRPPARLSGARSSRACRVDAGETDAPAAHGWPNPVTPKGMPISWMPASHYAPFSGPEDGCLCIPAILRWSGSCEPLKAARGKGPWVPIGDYLPQLDEIESAAPKRPADAATGEEGMSRRSSGPLGRHSL